MSGFLPKKPIPLAPAPSRFGLSKLRQPEVEEDFTESSSDEETQLVARSTTPRTGGLYAELEGEEDEEEFEEEHLVDEEDVTDRDEIIRARIASSQEQMRDLLVSLNESQLQRYETFRRVGFPRPMIRKVCLMRLCVVPILGR